MKLVKTIVAPAVVVFALTTVAMAGVQRLGHDGATHDSTAAPEASSGTTSRAGDSHDGGGTDHDDGQ